MLFNGEHYDGANLVFVFKTNIFSSCHAIILA